MALVKCLSCRETFLDSARHGRHLARQKKCEDFYDKLAERKALDELHAARVKKCCPAGEDEHEASRNSAPQARSPAASPRRSPSVLYAELNEQRPLSPQPLNEAYKRR